MFYFLRNHQTSTAAAAFYILLEVASFSSVVYIETEKQFSDKHGSYNCVCSDKTSLTCFHNVSLRYGELRTQMFLTEIGMDFFSKLGFQMSLSGFGSGIPVRPTVLLACMYCGATEGSGHLQSQIQQVHGGVYRRA